MKDQKKAEQIAAERVQLLAPLLTEGLDPAKAREIKQRICEQIGISERTLRRYLAAYRQEGFGGLKPKSKGKQPATPAISSEVLEQAILLRREVPSRSVAQIIQILEWEGRVQPGQIKRSTLQEKLTERGYSTANSGVAARRFAEELDPARFKVLYLSDSKLTPRHFYKGLLEQLGCESKFYRGDAKRQLHREIELMRGIHGLQPVVVVDEAHLLDHEMLEEVRFLLNFKMDAQSPMALILVGQSELWDRINLQAYAAIRQRIDLQCKLPHYDRAHTEAYIERHMAYAGAERDIFTDGAIDDIYRFSSGAARLINKICTHCLLYGAQNKHRIIDDHMVKRVIQGELS